MTTEDDGPPRDGRTARAVRTRDAIVDACIALVEDGDSSPTAHRVAISAGVSVRSVFQHFADVDGLYAAVGDRTVERLAALVLVIDPAAPLAERVDEVVRQRSHLLEVLTPIRRASAVHASRSHVIQERLREGHAFLRDELARVFAAELAAVVAVEGPAVAEELLSAVDVVLSWPAWDQLRSIVGLDPDDARAVQRRLLGAALGVRGDG